MEGVQHDNTLFRGVFLRGSNPSSNIGSVDNRSRRFPPGTFLMFRRPEVMAKGIPSEHATATLQPDITIKPVLIQQCTPLELCTGAYLRIGRLGRLALGRARGLELVRNGRQGSETEFSCASGLEEPLLQLALRPRFRSLDSDVQTAPM